MKDKAKNDHHVSDNFGISESNGSSSQSNDVNAACICIEHMKRGTRTHMLDLTVDRLFISNT